MNQGIQVINGFCFGIGFNFSCGAYEGRAAYGDLLGKN